MSHSKKAEKARKDFSASSPDWAMKFRLLEAEILTYQGRRPEVIALLNTRASPILQRAILRSRENLLCGLADARLGQAQQADMELQEAQRLSDASNSSVERRGSADRSCGSNLSRPLDRGRGPFRKSLKVAREQRDSFLEASDLLNLGLVAFEMEHYDEALALLNEAADFARPIQARPVT